MLEPISAQEPETTVDNAEVSYEVVLTVSEPAAVGPLFRLLRTVRDATVTRKRSGPDEGQLGVAEVLQLVVPSLAVLVVAIQTLPAFISSRRESVSITITRADRSVTVSWDNPPDPHKVFEIAERMLGDG